MAMVLSTEMSEDDDFYEEAQLLQGFSEEENAIPSSHKVPTRIIQRLYLSHFLSTWNSRVFEFGAVLYLATIYPGTLLPMSIYALTRGLAAIVFAPLVGQYIDTGNRLQVVRVSIIFQRLVVAASCLLLYILALGLPVGRVVKRSMLALLAFLACIEKLCSIMNSVAVEKDWVVVVAEKDQATLADMNAQMRRIDLFCKLFGPLFIALIDGFSTEVAIMINFGMNVASVVVEYFAIAMVYHEVPQLRRPKSPQRADHRDSESLPEIEDSSICNCRDVQNIMKKSVKDFNFYFRHSAFLPSISGALLYLTVLSFGGQMVTYLLSAGYNSMQVGITRTMGVLFEILSTWVAPWLMTRIGPVRAGLWMSSWQSATLTIGITIFWAFGEDNPVLAASGLVGGTILSRTGLRGFDLCTEVIVQDEVDEKSRGAFSSVEAACQNGCELFSFASTLIFSRTQQFKWPALISVTAVVSACVTYTTFVYLRRGHLVHLAALIKCFRNNNVAQRERERVVESIVLTSDI